LIPTLESGRNSTQIMPMSGLAGLGSAAVGGLEYLTIMASEGRAENFIFLRLGSVSLMEGDQCGVEGAYSMISSSPSDA